MPEIGEIDLGKVKARYSIEDINLVDIRDFNYANEYRIYFEIFFGIAVGLLGATISTFNWYLFSFTLFFFLIGFFFLGKFLVKYNNLLRKMKYKKKSYTAELKAKYPRENNGKTFQLIKSDAKPRYIYLLDNNTNKKHHIGSISTFRALEYDMSMVKKLDNDKFNSLEEGEKILIK